MGTLTERSRGSQGVGGMGDHGEKMAPSGGSWSSLSHANLGSKRPFWSVWQYFFPQPEKSRLVITVGHGGLNKPGKGALLPNPSPPTHFPPQKTCHSPIIPQTHPPATHPGLSESMAPAQYSMTMNCGWECKHCEEGSCSIRSPQQTARLIP